jgi:hypothetical protein
MALSATTEFDVRTTGDDNNGGAFNVGASGTDYSQQDAAQLTYTDLVIGGTNTQLTSAAFPFTAAHVGNVINITGGTGFTTGRYQVNSVSAGVATMDRGVGTASSTGGTGKLGGAMQNVATILTGPAGAYTIHVKAGTYSYTSTQAWQGNANARTYTIIGYQTTHRDGGTKPLFTTATNSVNLINAGWTEGTVFINLSFSNTAGTRGVGMYNSVGAWYPTYVIIDCTFDGFTHAIGGTGSNISGYKLIRTQIKNCSGNGVYSTSAGWMELYGCWIHHCATAVRFDGNLTMWRCVVSNCTSDGALQTSGTTLCRLFHCDFVSNGSAGFAAVGGWDAKQCLIIGCIFYGNTGYGVRVDTTFNANFFLYNGYGSNGSGNVNIPTFTAPSGNVTLTANPFTNSAGGDFSLNSAAGGGLALRNAAWRWRF